LTAGAGAADWNRGQWVEGKVTMSERQPVFLVGVGGSGAATSALIWAANQARRRDARLRVVQAWQAGPRRALYAGTAAGRTELISQAAAARRLAADVRAALGDAAGIDLETEVIEGTPERVLARASADADLLVLGTGRQSPVAQVDPLIVDRPVGPVIRACLSRACCPVVIIGPAAAAELDRPDRVLVGGAPARG
jgi:nucleotide-binding universal stress UspA family protein